MSNLLICLRKWVSRHDENFTTESLAHLLRHLCDHEPGIAARLLTKMTKSAVVFTPDSTPQTRITTQVTTTEGRRPDIEICLAGCLVLIEAKVESSLGNGQLESYRRELDYARQHRKVTRTALVLLTRYPPPHTNVKLEAKIRWHHIGEWISEEVLNPEINDRISAYLLKQFHGYLKERGLVMEPVSKELSSGARALASLLAMLYDAADAFDAQPQATKFALANGFTGFWLNKQRYFFGVRLESAHKVIFQTKNVRIDPQGVEKLGAGFVPDAFWDRGVPVWEDQLDLTSEDVNFFALSLAKQKECLEQFLERCLENVKKIEIPERGNSASSGTQDCAGDDVGSTV